MAKVTFGKDELATADTDGQAVVVFAVKAPHLKGFAFKNYALDLAAPPALANEAVKFFNEWSERVRAAVDAGE